MTLYWWNDALALAHELAASTQMPHQVRRTAGGWTVDLAERAILVEEPCS